MGTEPVGIRLSADIGPVTWETMKRLPEWALFHDDVVDVWNEVAAGQMVNGRVDLIIAAVCGRLRELDERERLSDG